MKSALLLVAAVALSACVESDDGLFKAGKEFSPFEEKRVSVTRKELNKSVSEHDVYFNVQTSGDQTERRFTLVVTRGRASTLLTKTKEELPGQISPDIALWQIRDESGNVLRQWEPHFQNRTRSPPGDEYLTTFLALPEDELKQSHLLLYFDDLDDDDDHRDHIVFDLDMTEFDWSTTSRMIYKAIVQ